MSCCNPIRVIISYCCHRSLYYLQLLSLGLVPLHLSEDRFSSNLLSKAHMIANGFDIIKMLGWLRYHQNVGLTSISSKCWADFDIIKMLGWLILCCTVDTLNHTDFWYCVNSVQHFSEEQFSKLLVMFTIIWHVRMITPFTMEFDDSRMDGHLFLVPM